MKKRLLATLLAVCLLIGMLPMAASAATTTTPTVVTKANLHDTRNEMDANDPDKVGAIVNDADLYGTYTISEGTAQTSDEIGDYTEYTVSATNLKPHYNAQNPEVLGYWIGATFTAPADKKVAKVRFTHTTDANGTVDGSIPIKDYDVTKIEGSIATSKFSFYNNLDASGATAENPNVTGTRWVKLQWLDASGNPISQLDNNGVEIIKINYTASLDLPVYGTAAWDPGKTGGSGCSVSVANVDDDPSKTKITVTGNVEWYPASQTDPSRPVNGNMVGVTITPPVGFNTQNSTWSWGDYTDQTWASGQDAGANTITFYSRLNASTKTDTFTVKWKEGNTQTFTVDASGATLKGEWPTISGLGTLTNGSVTATSKHSDRNEMDVANENNYVQPGAVVTLTLTAGSGYHVADTVTVNVASGQAVTAQAGENNTYTFTVPANATADNDLTLVNPFEADAPTTYAITNGTPAEDATTNHGSITAIKVDNAEVTEAEEGDTVTVTVTPESNYTCSGVTTNPTTTVTKTNDTTYTFTMPGEAVTVSATFTQTTVTPATHTLTLPSGVTAKVDNVDVANGGSVQTGKTVTLTVTAPEGQQLKAGSLKFNTTALNPTGNTATFEMPDADVTVSVEFETATVTPTTKYTITKGAITGADSGDVTIKVNGTAVTEAAEGDSVTVESATEGYRATSVTVTDADNGNVSAVDASNINVYTFTMPAKNVTVAATLGKLSYLLTLPSGVTAAKADGTPIDSQTTVEFGETVNLTVTIPEGKKLGTLKMNGQTLSVTDNAATFTMPAVDVTVTVTFTSTTPVTPVDPTPVDPTPVDPTPVEPSEPVVTTDTAADGTVTTTTTWDDGKEAVAVKTPEGKTEITVTAPNGESVAKVELAAQPAESKDFVDVKTGAWYETAVSTTTGYGLFNGTSETKFSPDAPMSRGMLATVLHNLSGNPTYGVGEGNFTDVKEGVWYNDPIDWAYKTGVASGTSATQFAPNDSITREQLVTMLYNYAKAIGAVSKNRTELVDFPDGGKVAGYAHDAMQWAVAEGFISGRANGGKNYIAPKNNASRAEVAIVMAKFVEYLK